MIPNMKGKKQHSQDITLVAYGYSCFWESQRQGGQGEKGVVHEQGEWCCLLSLDISSPD